MPIDCLHRELDTKCRVTHLANVDRYILEVAVRCADCHRAFIFQGLPGKPAGEFNLDGACTSPTGILGKFSVYPENLALSPVEDMLLLNKASGAGPDFLEAEDVTE
jgi:hypothetical protein